MKTTIKRAALIIAMIIIIIADLYAFGLALFTSDWSGWVSLISITCIAISVIPLGYIANTLNKTDAARN